MSDLSDAMDEKPDAAAAEEALLLQLNGDEGLLAALDDDDDVGGGGGGGESLSISSGGGAPPSSSSSYSATVQSSNSDVGGGHRSAWVAHGAIGAVVFGLLVPLAISSSLLRERMGEHWVFLHVGLNALSLLLTIAGVILAFVTMDGTIASGGAGGHMDERHHVAGLLLLLLVAFQNANGFLRPPRGGSSSPSSPGYAAGTAAGEDDDEGDGDHASTVPTVRRLWYHAAIGVFVFALGAYQVTSGLGLFASRFGTDDRGPAYLAYILLLAAAMLGVKATGAIRTKFKKKKKSKSEEGMSEAVFQFPQGEGGSNNLRSIGRRGQARRESHASSMVSAKWDEFSVDIDGAA